jgi:hypothetical protein
MTIDLEPMHRRSFLIAGNAAVVGFAFGWTPLARATVRPAPSALPLSDRFWHR